MVRYLKKRKTLKKEWLYKKLKQWNREYKKHEEKVIQDIKKHKNLLNAFSHEEFLENALRAKFGDEAAIAIGGSRSFKLKTKPPKDKKKFPDLDVVVFLPENRETKTSFPELDNPLLSYLTLTKLGLAGKREKYTGIKENIKGRKFLELWGVDKTQPEIAYKHDWDTTVTKNMARIKLKALRDKPFVKAWEKTEKVRAVVELLGSFHHRKNGLTFKEIQEVWGTEKTMVTTSESATGSVINATPKEVEKIQKYASRKKMFAKDLKPIIQHLIDMNAIKQKGERYHLNEKYEEHKGHYIENSIITDYWNEIKPGKRIIIKLGGGLIAPKKRKYRGLDKRIFKNLMKDIKELTEDGYQIGITVGGGKYGHRAVKDEPGVEEFKEERDKMHEMAYEVGRDFTRVLGKMDKMNKKEKAKEEKRMREKLEELAKQQEKVGGILEKYNYFHDANNRINQAIEKLHIKTKAEAEGHGLKIKRIVKPEDVVYHEKAISIKFLKPEESVWEHIKQMMTRAGKYRVEKKSLKEFEKELEKRKNIPSAYGMVIRRTGGKLEGKYKIASADNITEELALNTKADKVIFVTDVDGVYTKDPKTHKDAKHIPRGTPEEILAKVEDTKTKAIDATGAMRGKLGSSEKIANLGIPVHIISGKKKGSIMRAMSGDYIGTRILPKKKVSENEPNQKKKT